ncbi:hypothetical protein GC090_22040 (plasmid) [Pantoea sp. JZ29]|uniref:hypothetical protein n=1 Tax=Pantoea sp. JZ29 TaxID=2654192 RepID=UPI002B459ED8|nr:hypothetical protein [Pantoea sp. JZ29]WRH23336.1 hypothetical protein GC090_22040 [Pantoea sp. JZ29]
MKCLIAFPPLFFIALLLTVVHSFCFSIESNSNQESPVFSRHYDGLHESFIPVMNVIQSTRVMAFGRNGVQNSWADNTFTKPYQLHISPEHIYFRKNPCMVESCDDKPGKNRINRTQRLACLNKISAGQFELKKRSFRHSGEACTDRVVTKVCRTINSEFVLFIDLEIRCEHQPFFFIADWDDFEGGCFSDIKKIIKRMARFLSEQFTMAEARAPESLHPILSSSINLSQ